MAGLEETCVLVPGVAGHGTSISDPIIHGKMSLVVLYVIYRIARDGTGGFFVVVSSMASIGRNGI